MSKRYIRIGYNCFDIPDDMSSGEIGMLVSSVIQLKPCGYDGAPNDIPQDHSVDVVVKKQPVVNEVPKELAPDLPAIPISDEEF